MNALEVSAARLLRPLAFEPGAADLRFVHAMVLHAWVARSLPLTGGQSYNLFRLVFKYRRQIVERARSGKATRRRRKPPRWYLRRNW